MIWWGIELRMQDTEGEFGMTACGEVFASMTICGAEISGQRLGSAQFAKSCIAGESR